MYRALIRGPRASSRRSWPWSKVSSMLRTRLFMASSPLWSTSWRASPTSSAHHCTLWSVSSACPGRKPPCPPLKPVLTIRLSEHCDPRADRSGRHYLPGPQQPSQQSQCQRKEEGRLAGVGTRGFCRIDFRLTRQQETGGRRTIHVSSMAVNNKRAYNACDVGHIAVPGRDGI